jgi:hypothetical protein
MAARIEVLSKMRTIADRVANRQTQTGIFSQANARKRRAGVLIDMGGLRTRIE